jgi:hypothetical protein
MKTRHAGGGEKRWREANDVDNGRALHCGNANLNFFWCNKV